MGVARREVRVRERKAGWKNRTPLAGCCAFNHCTSLHTINLAQRPAQSLFPVCCFRRYPGLPGRRDTEGPDGDRGDFFLSSSGEVLSVDGVDPAGGRQSSA